MKRKLMTAVMITVLALGTAACSTPFTNKTDDAAEAITAKPEDVIKDEHGAHNAAGTNTAPDELIDAIRKLPVDPVDAVSGQDSGTGTESDPSDDILDQIEALPEDVITGPENPAVNNAQGTVTPAGSSAQKICEERGVPVRTGQDACI